MMFDTWNAARATHGLVGDTLGPVLRLYQQIKQVLFHANCEPWWGCCLPRAESHPVCVRVYVCVCREHGLFANSHQLFKTGPTRHMPPPKHPPTMQAQTMLPPKTHTQLYFRSQCSNTAALLHSSFEILCART